MLWAAKIPLRDGVRLNATVFKPRPQPETLPVVFTLTPYVADTYYARAQYFARRGYVLALVDVRGRGFPVLQQHLGAVHRAVAYVHERRHAEPEPLSRPDAGLSIPILTIIGHYDDDQPGALYYYRMHMNLGGADARSRHYLLIGPWDHAGTRMPNRDAGGLRSGEASVLDLNAPACGCRPGAGSIME
jgi:predicted acyl esterase